VKQIDKIKKLAKNRIKFYKSQLKRASLGQYPSKTAQFLTLIDISELIQYYNLVLKNQYKTAYDYMCDLDTEVRETISETIYEFVYNKIDWMDLNGL
jgi:hypothetical protein